MPTARFEVYNPDGSLQFSLDNRLLRTLTVTIDSGDEDGSTTIPGLGQGTFVAVAPPEDLTGVPPRFSIAGDNVSWTFGGAPAADRQPQSIQILVY